MEIADLLAFTVKNKASDLHLSAGLPPLIRVNGDIRRINVEPLDHKGVHSMIYDIMNDAQRKFYEENLEVDFSFEVPNLARFRVNAYVQQRGAAAAFRTIPSKVLTLEQLAAPAIFKDLCHHPNGIVLVTGPTGSGKSTTLAAMIDHRNAHSTSHILAIEDPIEFIHRHKRSIVNQREVGIDTTSYASALVNALREAPDVLLIGEIRDQETMRQALIYTQTGHLCLATLHANNAYHALNRIISLFPPETQEGLLLDLAMSLKAVISQRLVKGVDGKRVAAVEILINNLHIAELIQRREIDKIKEAIEQSLVEGAQTFEEALLELYVAGRISKEEALANADSRTNMEWLIANSGKYREMRAQRARGVMIDEDKVREDQETNLPGLLSVEDLDKLGVAGLSSHK